MEFSATTSNYSSTSLINISMDDNVTDDSFMEQVESYMTYKIAYYINQCWFPILAPIGLVGNTLSFMVMIQPHNRKMSTCIYMASIGINDNLMMCLVFHYWLVTVVKIHEWHLWECKVVAYFVNSSLQSSTYQVLAMTIDKYVAIKWPHRAATYSTPRRARTIPLGVIACAFSYNIPHLFASSLIGDQCFAYAVGGTMTRVYSWISFTVNGIIPFSMLIYMNSVIVQTVRNSRKMFRSVITTNAGREKEARQRTMKSAENQLTIMLLLVTMLFLILLLPTYIRFIYLTFIERDTPSKYASSMLFFQITFKLYTTNNGINFFLYCISGKKFRADLKEIFGSIATSCRPCFSVMRSKSISQISIRTVSASVNNTQ